MNRSATRPAAPGLRASPGRAARVKATLGPDELIIVRQRYTPFGGGERFLAQAMQTLASQGLRVRILCREWDGDVPYEVTRLPVASLTRAQRDRSFGRLACTYIRAAPRALVQSHERIPCCDIYRAGDGVHREWLMQRKQARGVLSSLLDRLSPYHRYVLAAERRLFHSRRLKTVICNSHMVKEEIQRHFGLPDERIAVIHNGVDTQHFHPGLRDLHRTEVRRQLGLPEDAVAFLFVGSGFERKGLDTVLRAFSDLPNNFHLLIVGHDRGVKAYRQLVTRLGAASRVSFCGPQHEVSPYYAAADVFVLPTLYDPFPNVVLEAMACGLPVITSYKSGAVDIIEHGINGWICDALDRDKLVSLMSECGNAARREAVGSAGHLTVLSMTFARMAQSYANLYRSMLHLSE